MTQHNSLIDTDSLSQLIEQDAEGLIVLFTTMTSGPAQQPAIVMRQPDARIPSSQFFDFQNQIVDKSSSLSHMMPDYKLFQHMVRQFGIDNDSTVVVYDDFGNFCASRVWFMFKTCGFDNVKVLDGGLPAWLRTRKATVTTYKEPMQSGNFIAEPSDKYQFVNKEAVLDNILTSQCALYDARSAERFSGKPDARKPDQRSGHIPHSQNIHYASLLDSDGKFLDQEQLRAIFNANQTGLMFSCGSGVTACILAQVADICGIHPLFVYDGSWAEWGADTSLPIERGTNGI